MKKSKILFITLLSICIVWCSPMSAAVTFRAIVENTTVEVGQPFRVQYRINSTDVANFHPAALRGFSRVAGPYSSTEQGYSNINGRSYSYQSTTYTLTLRATTEGTFTISPASIDVDGKTVHSNSLKIKVVPATSSSAASSSSGRNARSSNRGMGFSEPSSPTRVGDKDLFMQAHVSKTKVHEQEAFLLTYKIYTLVNLRGFNNVKLPDFKGFHSQEIPMNGATTLEPETYNGRVYGTAVYRQFLLFPQKSGKLRIPSAQFDAAVEIHLPSSDPLEALLKGTASRMREITMRTYELSIDVTPLPSPKPEDFCGGVGKFSVTSSIDRADIRTGEAFTLKITVDGAGNLKLIDIPKPSFPSDFEVYDPKVKENFKPTTQGMSGQKVFEYTIVPSNVGSYTIPALRISYFDTQSETYKTLQTSSHRLEVKKGKGGNTFQVKNYSDRENPVMTDIRPLHRMAQGKAPSWFMPGTASLWLAYLLPLALFIAVFVLFRKQAYYDTHVHLARKKRANRVALRRLRSAEKFLKQHNEAAFYDEVIRALWGYVSDKLSMPTAELSKENIRQCLSDRGITAQVVDLFLKNLDECEYARYAPGDKHANMERIYNEAIEVITALDDKLKK